MTTQEFKKKVLKEIRRLLKGLEEDPHFPIEDSERSQIDGAKSVLDWLKEYINSIKI